MVNGELLMVNGELRMVNEKQFLRYQLTIHHSPLTIIHYPLTIILLHQKHLPHLRKFRGFHSQPVDAGSHGRAVLMPAIPGNRMLTGW